MDKNSKILVVGHNDVIEKSLFAHFQSQGYRHIFSSSQMGLNTTIQTAVYDFFSQNKPEYVFLASTRSGGIEANQKNAGEFIYHNLESQNNILYASWKFGVKKLLFFASSCIYPKACAQPMKEEYLLTGELEGTSEPYAIAKIAGVKLCQAFRRQYGLNAIVMVPATIYGPQCDTDLAKAHVMGALIGKFSKAVKQGEREVVIWGSGQARREFLYVDDLVDASLFLMAHYEGEAMVNVGTGEDIAIGDLAQMISGISGFKGVIRYDASKPDGAPRKLLDNTRMHKLGWKPKVSLKEGIKKTYNWYWGQLQSCPPS